MSHVPRPPSSALREKQKRLTFVIGAGPALPGPSPRYFTETLNRAGADGLSAGLPEWEALRWDLH
jgi:hypothetical protein